VDIGQSRKQKTNLSKTFNDNQTFHRTLSKLKMVNSNTAILKFIPGYNLKFKISNIFLEHV